MVDQHGAAACCCIAVLARAAIAVLVKPSRLIRNRLPILHYGCGSGWERFSLPSLDGLLRRLAPIRAS